MEYEDKIRINKSAIASVDDAIKREEQALGGRCESSIIKYY